MELDADHISEDSLQADVCVVGAGPAGITLATQLAKFGMDVLVVESGGKFSEPEINQLNQFDARSNFTFRKNFTNRYRQIGGSANLWPGRVVPYQFDPELDSEWGDFIGILPQYYEVADSFFGVNPELVRKYGQKDDYLTAYWAPVTQRFNYQSDLVRKAGFRIVYHLNCCGEVVMDDAQVAEMVFKTHEGRRVQIRANRYVLATGGIENARLLLLMASALETCSGEHYSNVGRYIMDHPKITEGRVRLKKECPEFFDYHLRIARHGKVKYGMRKRYPGMRIYCNLVESRSKRVQKLYASCAEKFKKLTGKVLSNDKQEKSELIDDLIYLLEPKELVPHWLNRAVDRITYKRTKGKYKVITYLEQRPRRENRISLQSERLDAFGNPLPLIELDLADEEIKATLDFYRDLEERLDFEAVDFRYAPERLSKGESYTEASHHLGGTRYSSDLSRSVVDKDLSVIGVGNLHVAGSSVFPTGGIENPTHLIVSLSCYLADRILEKS